ncbi:Calexcitin-1 [Trichinella pseudospiralis]|uniref:Calexcitin-1 n=2 Tax=Trichinella pseudospiralis TaxID=6337 RepID=A0A0V1FKC6_TRIPS|nr:Calexcitin-1 [Trichinella pseudospiralis]KRY86325.1 Calexcitin-1 [Trichinella pseudospiralis]KRZ20508.1 Calexcitin-1 [Trichinella pseudospiralis]KRZ35904.1 Calexcitin-1 [Trichinella pseudospiralis]
MPLSGWSVLNMQERADQHASSKIQARTDYAANFFQLGCSTGLVVAKFHFGILCFLAFSCHLNLVKSVFVSSVEHLAMPFNEENAFSDVHPFLLSKWKSIFITFFDSNNSKEIDWSDFYLITKRVGDLYGVDSEQMRLTRKRMQPLWDGLVELADLNKDEKIQLSEWVDFLKRCENGQNAEMRWIQEYMNFVFQLFDVSCDGKIDFPEYVDGMKTYGVAESTARRAFSLITDACDHDHAKAFFDKATFNNLWKQYFFSKDKLATGNHLFGMVE